jgi:hypothetical protein
MRKLLSMTLALTILGTWLVPNAADAGVFGRLFGRVRNDSGTVVRPATESDGYRRFSYDPTATYPSKVRGNNPAKPTYMYPKTDPRRYEARF